MRYIFRSTVSLITRVDFNFLRDLNSIRVRVVTADRKKIVPTVETVFPKSYKLYPHRPFGPVFFRFECIFGFRLHRPSRYRREFLNFHFISAFIGISGGCRLFSVSVDFSRFLNRGTILTGRVSNGHHGGQIFTPNGYELGVISGIRVGCWRQLKAVCLELKAIKGTFYWSVITVTLRGIRFENSKIDFGILMSSKTKFGISVVLLSFKWFYRFQLWFYVPELMVLSIWSFFNGRIVVLRFKAN